LAPLKLLVVAPQPFFQPRGTPFSVYYRTLVLAEQGTDIDLLTYGEGTDVDIPRTRIVRIPRIRFFEPMPIGPSWRKLFLDFFMIAWTVGLLIRHRYDVVHAHEEAVFWCCLLRPLFRFRLVYDMHSSLPQQLGNFSFSTSKRLVGAFRTLEDMSLRGANAVITICPDLRDLALAAGVHPTKHLLIENCIFDDVRMKTATASSGAAADSGAEVILAALDPSRPVILYAGTFEAYQGVDIAIEAVALVSRELPQVQTVLVGGTAEQVSQMQSLAARLGVTCTFTGRVSKSLAMRFNEAATVLLSPRLKGTNTPLKIYEQLASGKPLVATRVWSHTQVLSEDVCELVEPDPRSMAQGILRVLKDAELRARMTANAHGLYQRQYSRFVYEEKIRRLLEIVG
jgi:glycosyltransferase involved in cell wall biosynthesis